MSTSSTDELISLPLRVFCCLFLSHSHYWICSFSFPFFLDEFTPQPYVPQHAALLQFFHFATIRWLLSACPAHNQILFHALCFMCLFQHMHASHHMNHRWFHNRVHKRIIGSFIIRYTNVHIHTHPHIHACAKHMHIYTPTHLHTYTPTRLHACTPTRLHNLHT